MVAFNFILSATVFSVASLAYAAPTTYHAELEARTFEDALEHFFARDLPQRPSSAPPATVSSLQGVTSTFGSALKSHKNDKRVLAGMPSGKRQWNKVSNHHGDGDHQSHHVLASNIDGTNKRMKYTSQTHELDSAESHPRLNKRLPPFPSKHHCPVCHKSPPKAKGYCKDHQWVCDDHSGRPWVQTNGENCQNCGNPPPKGKKNRR